MGIQNSRTQSQLFSAMLHNRQLMKSSQNKGFTLTELLVTTAIIATGASLSLPSFVRNAKQGDVDRYTQAVESGFFNLRAKLGTTKSSCQLSFPAANQFQSPWKVLEFQQPSGGVANVSRIECCNSKEGCINGPTYRMISREGTPERNAVEVATTKTDFMMTPPGTSAEVGNLTILIRSKDWDQASVQDSSGNSRLLTRCIDISGSGSISRGTWDQANSTCNT
jgi:prepilin-type N-terminal cleavage/methylation domain-containing protein